MDLVVGGGGGTSEGGSGTVGTTNRGAGGGGGAGNAGAGGNGGSGIVIIRYLTADISVAIGGTITTDGLHTIHTFTTGGTFNKTRFTGTTTGTTTNNEHTEAIRGCMGGSRRQDYASEYENENECKLKCIF